MISHSSLRVIVDTSAFFAIYSATDRHHEAAVAILRRLMAERWWLFTTNYLIAESHALLLNRTNRATALAFLDDVHSGMASIVRITTENEQHAIDIIRRYADKTFSLTDASSFAIAERLGIECCFSFDADFAQFGLRPLRASDA